MCTLFSKYGNHTSTPYHRRDPGNDIRGLENRVPKIGDSSRRLDKSATQRQLLAHIVARATSTPASQTKAPPIYAAVKNGQLAPDREGLNLEDLNLEVSDHEEEDLETQDQDLQKTLYSPPRQGDSILHPRGVQNVAPADQSSEVIRFRQDRPKPPAPSRTMPQYSDDSDIQLQLRA